MPNQGVIGSAANGAVSGAVIASLGGPLCAGAGAGIGALAGVAGSIGGSVVMAVYSTGGWVRGRHAGQTLEGSFSAVSTPIFSSKY